MSLKRDRLTRFFVMRSTMAKPTTSPDLMPIMGSEDAIERVMSFIERREANFRER
jgi:hypothetical protein